MAIKISKVIADLNVGRQTIEEFLHKKGIEISANINARIDDDIYEILVKEFKPDMDLKNKSDKMANERQKEKAKQSAVKESHEIKTVLPGQKPKILGKIDLDAAGKPKPAAKPASEPEAKEETTVKEAPVEKETVELKAEPKQEPKAKPEPQPVPEPAPEPEPQPEPKAEPEPAPVAPQVEEQPVAAAEPEQNVVEETQDSKEDDVFKPVSETVSGPQLKVVGKVDLTSINQQTRPRKKSKEEKRNERIAKAQAENAGKKKRKRIGKEKVDIESAGNQPASQSGKGRGGKDDQGGKRSKDKKNRRPLRPEVSEEDVQRQMKETLARLTAKNSKKAAATRRREKREEFREELREEAAMAAAQSKVLKLTEFVTANDLASMMNVPINKVIATCMSLGVM
ncbi:MAG: translation initiation factor IF-2, partial [Muribaculaceae bacterium]|nr:translation initiation factor IF-2 [Muribaculaceae bacterium]